MSVIDDIKDRIDLVDLVGETVKLKKSGRTFTGFCPFHSNTRTPSFVVWPETGTWKCFGACNTGGDAFTYLMKRDGLEFRDALEALAARTGVELPRQAASQEVAEKSDRLREAVAAAAQWFNYLLTHNPQAHVALDHLRRRGVSDATIEKFQLGYALDDWHALENYLNGKGFKREELIDAGLLVSRDDGNVFDRFRNRLMIPIYDGKGRPIGFGARALKDSDEPKYLNSPQTDLFDKSHTLYALHFARSAIRETGRAVIVEGYLDAIAAHQGGFANVVASLGTALTEAQLRQLKKLTKRFVLALDADIAGLNAMLRGLETARDVFNLRGLVALEGKMQADFRALVLPKDQDPDDVIRHEPGKWTDLVDKAKPVVEYVIDTLAAAHDLDTPKEKVALVEEVTPFLIVMGSPVERATYVQRLARLLRVDERAVIEQIKNFERSQRVKRSGASTEPTRTIADRERYCLTELLRAPYALQAIDDALSRAELPPFDVEDFDDVTHRTAFTALQAALAETSDPKIDDVLDRLDPSLHVEVTAWIESSPARPAIDQGVDETRGVVDAALLLRERNLKNYDAQLTELIRAASEDNDADSIRELSQAKLSVSDRLMRLSRMRYAPERVRQAHSDSIS